ncbi:lecithin retinol acyltransferase family protein [Trinickia sp.]|uniref:lecithin retinol acyltransferase family protein n=1 Tax=Trinickia sp. TaxID=2571163 RepID=UPI003F7EF699
MNTLLIDRHATSQMWEQAAHAIQPGAHLVSDRDGYTHHGIYVGNGLVIHYGGFHESSARRPVEYVALRGFCAGRSVRVQPEPGAIYGAEEAVERAKSRLGEDRYRLLTNNCEHFCTWCVRGVGRSEQVRRCLRNPWVGMTTLLAISLGWYRPHRRPSRLRRYAGELSRFIATHSIPQALARA